MFILWLKMVGLPKIRLLVGNDLAGEVFVAREPHEFQFPGSVVGRGDHAHLFAHADGREVRDFSFYLNVGEV